MGEFRSTKRRRVAAEQPAAEPDAKEERRFQRWIESYAAVSKWMAQYDLDKALDEGGGLAWLPDFLPGAGNWRMRLHWC